MHAKRVYRVLAQYLSDNVGSYNFTVGRVCCHSHWQMNYVHKLWPVAIAKCQLLVVNLFVFFPCCFYSCHLCMKEATSAELSAWTSNMGIHSHGDISIGPIANASDHRTESRKVIFDRIRVLAVGTEYSFSNKIKATFHLFAFAFHIEKKREENFRVLFWFGRPRIARSHSGMS